MAVEVLRDELHRLDDTPGSQDRILLITIEVIDDP